MSRSIKAIKLLHLLKDSSKENNEYVKVSKILNVLDTDDRNVRRIVTLLNDNLDLKIDSKTGKDGGYRLSSDIYAYFLGISLDELDSLRLLKEAFLRLDNISFREGEALSVLEKITSSDKNVKEIPYKSHLIYEEEETEDDFIIL